MRKAEPELTRKSAVAWASALDGEDCRGVCVCVKSTGRTNVRMCAFV